jgi:NAD(P)H-dependent FMN reductase
VSPWNGDATGHVQETVHLVAISGSLKQSSANSALVHALAAAAPAQVEIWDELGELPHFTPDDDGGPAVAALRAAVTRADALLIATPEYAGGMPGALKNALDWLVGTGELYDQPVAVMSAAPSPERGVNARRWVEEVVRMQGGHVVESFTVTAQDDPRAVLARVVDAFDVARG